MRLRSVVRARVRRVSVRASVTGTISLQYRAKILAGKNVSEMTYFVSSGT